MYRYFIQPQLNKFTNSLIGYETLIRKSADDRWILPQNFASIPLDIQVDLLKQVANRLALKVGSVSFNLNRTQFINRDMATALIDAQHAIYPVTLVVEVTEEESDQDVSLAQLKQAAAEYEQHGLQLSLDDVGTGRNVYENIKALLPEASEIKVAMQNFRQSERTTEIPTQLRYWRDIARKNQLRLIVEGIETAEDDALLDDLEIPLRQGYYYGKPHLFS